METKQINTRIILRNDLSTVWAQHTDVVLLKGEVGIEFLENGKVKIKVGDGSKTWKELPYFGGEEVHVFEVTPKEKEDHNTALNRVATAPVKGDVAIVSETFANGKVSKTAYIYNGEAWAAMDGNYNAENVYFDKDLQTTAAIGNITLTNGQANIEAKGKNLAEVWETIFVKENEAFNVVQPSAEFKDVNLQYIEVGSSKSANIKLAYEDGEYEYGYATDEQGHGLSIGSTGDLAKNTVNNGTTGAKDNVYTVNYNSQAVKPTSAHNYTINSGIENNKATKSVSGSISYEDGFMPVSNLKKMVTQKQIKAGNATANEELFRWYIPMFHGFKTAENVIANPKAITNLEVAALTKITGLQAYNGTVPTSEKASGAWNQYFIAVPTSLGKRRPTIIDDNKLPLTVETANNVTITLGTASIEYNVYFVSLAAPYKTLEINVNW